MKKRIHSALLAVFAFLSFAQAAHAIRSDLTVVVPPDLKAGSITAGAATLTMTGANSAGGYQFTANGGEFIIVQNTHATNPGTVTVTSTPDRYGRTGDLPTAYSIPAGGIAVFGPYPSLGWRQTNGKINVSASIDEIKIGVIRPQ